MKDNRRRWVVLIASRPIGGGWATIACLACIFSLCVWEIHREGEISFLTIFAAITACLTLVTAIILVMALVMKRLKRFTRFMQILSRPVGRRVALGSLVTLFFIYYCVGLLPFRNTQDILYIGILIAGGITFVFAIAFIAVVDTRRSSRHGEPSATPNGGPATSFGNPKVSEGPPSVS